MVLRMPGPVRRKGSDIWYYQRRVPRAVIELAAGRSFFISLPSNDNQAMPLEVRPTATGTMWFSLHTTDEVLANLRHAAALSQLERHWENLKNGPVALSRKQRSALSGEVYRLFVDRFEESPGSREAWEAVKGFNRAVREGRVELAPRLSPEALGANLVARAQFGEGLTTGINSLPSGPISASAVEARFGWLTDWVLALHGLSVDANSRWELLLDVEDASTRAARRLRHHADGDYSPDVMKDAERYPPVSHTATNPVQGRKAGATFDTLFEAWADPKVVAPSSIRRWKNLFTRDFPQFLESRAGHKDPGRTTKDDVVAWRDHLLKSGLAPRTVKRVNIACLNAIFGQAVADGILSINPAADVTVREDRRIEERERGFTDEEAHAILTAARNLPRGRLDAKTHAFLRWAPFIMAYTGARVGEIAQLRKSDFTQSQAEGWVLTVTPEAGSTKSGKLRKVPLHDALVSEGLPDFVHGAKDGPLFYAKHGGRLAAKAIQFVRKTVKVTDKRVAPNHGWRHRFITLARGVNMAEEKRNYIVGHTDARVGSSYGNMAGLKAAINLIPLSIPLPANNR